MGNGGSISESTLYKNGRLLLSVLVAWLLLELQAATHLAQRVRVVEMASDS